MGNGKKKMVVDAGKASEAEGKEEGVRVRIKKPGFMVGLRWGWAGVGWAARRPFFCSLGIGLLLVALVVAWMVPLGGFVAAAAVVSGIACSGAAGRALASAPPGSKSPWRSWWEPWEAKNRRRHMGKVATSGAVFMALGLASQQLTALIYQPLDPLAGMTSWQARTGSAVLCYVLLVWLLASAGPIRGARDSWASLGRVARAPAALMGFAAFWFSFLALTDTVFSFVILLAVPTGPGTATVGLAALVVFATLVASAPAMAMSAGLSSLDLDPPDMTGEEAVEKVEA